MASETDIRRCVESLDRVFHNEKDFHIAFSRELESVVEEGVVRPEFPVDNPLSDERETTYLDIVHLTDERSTVIELKYPLDEFRSTETLYGLEETFRHSDIRAYDVPMYEFWKDVATVERVVERGDFDAGYVLSLTNYEGCWEKRGEHLIAADFLTYDHRVVSGTLAYSDDASAKTHEDYPPIRLSRSYEMVWHHYSYTHPSNPTGETTFKYQLTEADSDGDADRS